MPLHTVFAGTTVGGSTGSGTLDTIASSGFAPSADAEVQVRGGSVPRWIGIDSYSSEIVQIGATTAKDYIQVSLNTDTQANYFISHYRKKMVGAAAKYGNQIEEGVLWWEGAIPLDQDADWTVKLANTTASKTNVIALYESYGNVIPPRGGRIISRKVTFTSDDTAWPTFTAGPLITDLDPRLMYRVAGMGLLNVEDNDHVAIRVTSPSNNTYVGAICGSWTSTTYHPNCTTTWFPIDSIIVSGVESVSLESASTVAQKPNAVVYFEEYGASSSAGAAGGASNLGGGQSMIGPISFGGQGGFLSGIFGR